jgi:hypothetical protein
VTDSTGGEGRNDAPPPIHAATAANPPSAHPATEPSPRPAHPATELDRSRPTDEGGWDPTSTGPGGLRRHGPGVPGPAAAERAAPTAEEVWRTGLPSGPPPGRVGRRWRRRAGSALTVALLIAVGVVTYLRLRHG